MQTHTIQIRVSGFTADEVRGALPDLLEEFMQRPWLIEPQARWVVSTQQVLIEIKRDVADNDPDGAATLDEVWDCVIATIPFNSSRIEFEIIVT